MIEVSSLSKRYGNHLAVDKVSFSIQKGEVVGFLGPNGAGKSTIMNIMTGYLSLTAGSVSIDGFDVVEQPEEAVVEEFVAPTRFQPGTRPVHDISRTAKTVRPQADVE